MINKKFNVFVISRYQTNTANEMLDKVVSIQPKDASGTGGETREAVVYRLADEMLAKLPDDYVAHEVSDLASLWFPNSISGEHKRSEIEIFAFN